MTDRKDPSSQNGTTATSFRLQVAGVILFGLTLATGGIWLGSTGGPHEEAAPAPQPAPEPVFDTEVERGAHLFRNNGCFACHGEEGAGGIVNENYAAGTVPALDEMADRLMLYGPEDAEMVLGMIEDGTDPTSLSDDPPYPEYVRFVAQWDAVRTVIVEGATAHKADENGPVPPLQMPAWGDSLSGDEIDAILAYLISLYDWDEEYAAEEDEEYLPEEETGEI